MYSVCSFQHPPPPLHNPHLLIVFFAALLFRQLVRGYENRKNDQVFFLTSKKIFTKQNADTPKTKYKLVIFPEVYNTRVKTVNSV